MKLSYPKEEFFHSPHSGCPGCGIALALRYFLKGLGEKVVFVMPVGCSGVMVHLPTRRISHEGELIKVLSVPYGSTATFAGGVSTGLKLKGDMESKVVAWAGDGATFDIGFQGLSGAAERNEDIIYVCCDNEAYMNTGNQRSSATPQSASTSTSPHPAPKRERKKDIALIMAAHNIPYVATTTVGYPEDFLNKVRKARGIEGFRFFHILCPCPTGWKFRASWTIKMSRLAVATHAFPLFEVQEGYGLRITVDREKSPLEEYIKAQGRFAGLSEPDRGNLEKEIDERWDRLQWFSGYEPRRAQQRAAGKCV
jgi:pyruvate/2-oxoacid:ferredoxin oxidoreductase beta subunit